MNILVFNFGSYIHSDLLYFLQKAGHHCKSIMYKFQNLYEDAFFEKRFSYYLKNANYDCVISTNFFPLIAKLCYENSIKYLAWSYDSPISRSHLEYYAYPTNFIFLFDRDEVNFFHEQGLENFYHLPLAVNTIRLSSIKPSAKEIERYSCDISFIGQFYQSPLKDLLLLQDDYTKGYINAVADAQFRIYGYNFVSELISDSIIEKMNLNYAKNNLQIYESGGEKLSRAGLIHSIDKQITRTERILLLKLFAPKYNVHLYSTESVPLLSEIPFQGPADYFSEMPLIFKLSKVNLNPTLRSIHSGIPLRALDIIGSGGFLLSNFQPELAEFFPSDVAVAMYDSVEDALSKADFYLSHEVQRLTLIKNAHQIIETHFTYPDRINKMFQIAGLGLI